MLVLSRFEDERIQIGDDIVIVVCDIVAQYGQRRKVRIGIEAPKDVPVHRMEVVEAIQRDGKRKR